jgi:uncharacterized surface protein with fasciclin (FAS1) repeats
LALIRLVLMASIAALPLAACGGADKGNTGTANASNEAAAAAPASNQTLAAALHDDGDLDTLDDVARNAGLEDVLGGVGPYTLFAPNDAAFTAFGEDRANALKGAAMRPQAIALLRGHIVPGMITRRDLEAALDNAHGRPVTMRTMGPGSLTFARDGDAIVVSSDGARARLVGDEAVATNGAIHPIDAPLLAGQAAAE